MTKWAYNLSGSVIRLFYGFKVIGREHIPEGGCIICANHTANIDAALLLLAMNTTDFVALAKAELFQHKIVARLLTKIGAVPVKRGKRDLNAVRTALQALKHGKKVMIFPEGTRVMDGSEIDGKAGAAMLATRAGVPIVPAYITEGKKAFRKCRVVFGNKIDPVCKKGHEAYQRLTNQIMDEIRALGKGESR